MNPTSPSPAQHPRDLFLEVLEKATPAERAAFLDDACRENAALRGAVEELLAHHREDSFLEAPALSIPTGLTPPSEQPGQRIGHYKLLQEIGEGGFGIVWMAEQEQPVRRRVALKIIKMGMDTKEVIARFEQERQALAMMDHPNIAKVFDGGATQSGRPFFVMELVRGVKITEYCDEQQLSTEQRLALFIQVCQAVQHAHQKGIIHRDLKPSNILVTADEGEAVPKVIDFGVAKATQGRLTDATFFTQFQQMVGTPLYMSPEQAELTSLDSDIYSLGVLLYELLTGYTPIDTTTLAKAGMDEIRRIIREVDPPRPSARVKTLVGKELTTVAKRRHTDAAKLPAALRGDLDWIVTKCLEKDRKRRYDTANGLAHDLQRHLANEVVTARPPTAAYLISKLIRRNKLAVTAGAAIAASLVIGIAASVWQAVRADHEAKRAVAALDELRSAAPAFAAQARSLAGRERFVEAIEKLDYAIKLRPDVIDHFLAKADLLQCQLQFAGAATAYRAALRLKPDHARAQANAALCDKLQAELDAGTKLSRESLMQLFQAMIAEHRPAAELLTVGRMVGEEKKLILDYWVERLKALPLPPVMPIEKQLTMLGDGTLQLELTNAPIVDLAPLEGMPLAALNLLGCTAVADLRPLSGLPLRILILAGTKVTDLAPLAKIRTLKELDLSRTDARDLSPLSGLPLEKLDLNSSKVADLAPLRGLPLRYLVLRNTAVSDITPLAGVPLEFLDCTSIPTADFSALSGAPMKTLYLQLSRVGDLSCLHGMPLETLILHGCTLARGFQVLSELTSLKVLSLPGQPWNLPVEELAALAALRQHPALRQIEIGAAIPNINTIGSIADFWKAWDRDVSCVLALHRDGVKFSTDRRQDGGLSVKIDDPTFKDLAVFQGANLASLALYGTSVSDLTPLAGLPLKELHLTRTPVTDLSPLAGFALEELRVKEMPVRDLSVLSRAPLRDSLRKLFLEYLKVTDFSPVATCKSLRLFSAFHSSITDLAPLRGLHLQTLSISGTKVHDLSALAGLPLDEFLFDFTTVTDITPLQNISSLQRVVLSENVEKVETLRKLPNLQHISFFWDRKGIKPSMTAAQFWKSLDAINPWMTRLHDAGIKVKSLKPLDDGTCEVNLEGSTIKDLTVLNGAPISILRLGGTPVSDLSPLRGIVLKKLYLQNTMVTDLSPIKGMLLESLNVSGTKVADLSVLRSLPLLYLRLHQCPNIVDLSPLKSCTTLQKLSLPRQAKDFEFLRNFPKLELLSFTEDLATLVPDRTAARFWEEYDAKKP